MNYDKSKPWWLSLWGYTTDFDLESTEEELQRQKDFKAEIEQATEERIKAGIRSDE